MVLSKQRWSSIAMLSVQALAANPEIRVTFVGVTRRYQQCQEGVQAQSNAASAIQYRCLAPEHFVPAVKNSFKPQRLSDPDCTWCCLLWVESRCRHVFCILAGLQCMQACQQRSQGRFDTIQSLPSSFAKDDGNMLPCACHDRGQMCSLYTGLPSMHAGISTEVRYAPSMIYRRQGQVQSGADRQQPFGIVQTS